MRRDIQIICLFFITYWWINESCRWNRARVQFASRYILNINAFNHKRNPNLTISQIFNNNIFLTFIFRYINDFGLIWQIFDTKMVITVHVFRIKWCSSAHNFFFLLQILLFFRKWEFLFWNRYIFSCIKLFLENIQLLRIHSKVIGRNSKSICENVFS